MCESQCKKVWQPLPNITSTRLNPVWKQNFFRDCYLQTPLLMTFQPPSNSSINSCSTAKQIIQIQIVVDMLWIMIKSLCPSYALTTRVKSSRLNRERINYYFKVVYPTKLRSFNLYYSNQVLSDYSLLI